MKDFDTKSVFDPYQAIVVYKETKGEQFYLESHPLYQVSGQTVMGEGKPLTKGSIEKMASYFYMDSPCSFKPKKLLPEQIVYLDNRGSGLSILWLSKACVQPLYFSSSLSIPCGNAYCPTLLFAAKEDTLYVFALDSEQVREESKLYIAPFHNVYPDGKVCLGNTKVGKISGCEYRQVMAEWEKAFFNSEFTALHSDGSPTVTNVNTLWKHLIESKEPFPTGELKLHPFKTVGNLVETF